MEFAFFTYGATIKNWSFQDIRHDMEYYENISLKHFSTFSYGNSEHNIPPFIV
jgi:hypothetical protein